MRTVRADRGRPCRAPEPPSRRRALAQLAAVVAVPCGMFTLVATGAASAALTALGLGLVVLGLVANVALNRTPGMLPNANLRALAAAAEVPPQPVVWAVNTLVVAVGIIGLARLAAAVTGA